MYRLACLLARMRISKKLLIGVKLLIHGMGNCVVHAMIALSLTASKKNHTLAGRVKLNAVIVIPVPSV